MATYPPSKDFKRLQKTSKDFKRLQSSSKTSKPPYPDLSKDFKNFEPF